MSSTNEFFVTLPSNSSEIYFKNSASDFTTRLSYPIDLHGRWEVALAEIHYSHTWKTLPQGSRIIIQQHTIKRLEDGVNIRDLSMDEQYHLQNYHWLTSDEVEEYSFWMTAGYYDTITEVIEEIRKHMPEEVKDLILISVQETTRLIKLEILKADLFIEFTDPKLCNLLGARVYTDGSKSSYGSNGPITTFLEYPPDMETGMYALYVYTDIVSPVLVGDTVAPLLRIVPTSGIYGDMVGLSFNKLHYVPLRFNQISTIGLNISSDTGETIQFDYGKTIVKLHFRPRRLSYL